MPQTALAARSFNTDRLSTEADLNGSPFPPDCRCACGEQHCWLAGRETGCRHVEQRKRHRSDNDIRIWHDASTVGGNCGADSARGSQFDSGNETVDDDLLNSPSRWTVEKIVIDGLVAAVELRPSGAVGAAVPADGGRIVPNPDVVVGPVTLALLDVPTAGFSTSQPTVLLAASTPTVGWKGRTVQIGFGGQTIGVETARSKSGLGHALTALGSGTTELIDSENTLDVALIDADQWLTSCDDEALAAGENLAVLGSEVLQFGQVLPLGGGQFRLSRLLRGRGGTEWACSGHSNGEVFCRIKTASLQSVMLPGWSIGATVAATVTGGNGASIGFGAEGLRPPSPVNLAAERLSSGDLMIRWTRRSRQGFAWVDGTDAPLGEAREQYSVAITGSLGAIELTSDQSNVVVPGMTVASVGAGLASIEVRQIGDFAASHPAQLVINLS